MALCLQDKLLAEFKEKIVPSMFGVLQKQIKDGHFNGSDGVCVVVLYFSSASYVYNYVTCIAQWHRKLGIVLW